MIRWLLCLVLCLTCSALLAQSPTQPRLTVELEENETIPGQPVTLRLTVLVPTWMPDPPVWPEFDMANVRITQPERASSAISQTIDGETWSGVTRRYLITPMIPGPVTLPASTLSLSYAQPPETDPLTATLTLEAITVTGIVPKGAENLDPFIAAENLTLTQSVTQDGPDAAPADFSSLTAGNSLTRTVTAKVSGLSPMFLPALVPTEAPDGLRAYPDSPVLAEKSERGDLTGTRTEAVTYVVEGAVDGALPALSLDWYNLSSGKVETATLDAIAVQATAPRTTAPSARTVNWRALLVRLGLGLGLGLLALIGLTLALRWAWPDLARWWRARQHRRRTSAAQAWRDLRAALRAHDLSAALTALSLWQSRGGTLTEADTDKIAAAFAAIGRARFGPDPDMAQDSYWQSLSRLLDCAKQAGSSRRQTDTALPALNPGASPRT